ncbi:unnamed protein product [marine sediment metagenome]|uniref:SRP54-type proteins GTP-binding domain-containing protein n=1 Tax=marine sediment metagenome TaxID=412755 RepID=X1B0R8_9ZZZZ
MKNKSMWIIKTMNIKNVFSEFKEGLYKSRIELANKLGFLFSDSKDKSDFLEKLEELLILSDLGTSATADIMNEFQQINFREYKENNFIFFKEKLKATLIDILNSTALDIKINEDRLNIIMLVGVNGSGKTSVAAKIAYRLKNINKDIIMVPCNPTNIIIVGGAGFILMSFCLDPNVEVISPSTIFIIC